MPVPLSVIEQRATVPVTTDTSFTTPAPPAPAPANSELIGARYPI